MGRHRFGDQRPRAHNRLLANLDPAQNRHVGCHPTMIADHHGLDSFDARGIQVVLIRIEDSRAGTNPDAITNIQARFRAQVTSVEKTLAPDPDMRTGERKDDDGRNVGPEPGVGANLDMGALRDGDMDPMRSSFGIHTRTDREARTRCKLEMARRKIAADVVGQ